MSYLKCVETTGIFFAIIIGFLWLNSYLEEHCEMLHDALWAVITILILSGFLYLWTNN